MHDINSSNIVILHFCTGHLCDSCWAEQYKVCTSPFLTIPQALSFKRRWFHISGDWSPMIYLKSFFSLDRTDCTSWDDCICSECLRLGVVSQWVKNEVISDFLKISHWNYSYAYQPFHNQERFSSMFSKNLFTSFCQSLALEFARSRWRLCYSCF